MTFGKTFSGQDLEGEHRSVNVFPVESKCGEIDSGYDVVTEDLNLQKQDGFSIADGKSPASPRGQTPRLQPQDCSRLDPKS